MNNAIEEIKRQYTPIVQPVRLFETRNNKQTPNKELSEFINTINNSSNNPFHPDISNSKKGRCLDIMG
ncbi:MAG: hypothetical protein ACI37Q_06905 [Candidatus Gastranaerophilaceae bacterium]